MTRSPRSRPAPLAFVESLRWAERNLYARARQLVGDRDTRAHELSVQLRAFDVSRNGRALEMPALLALCSALLQRSLKGGLITIGAPNLGGTVDPVHNALALAELAAEKGAAALLMPVSSRRQLLELSDDMATKIGVQSYTDAREALVKALLD